MTEYKLPTPDNALERLLGFRIKLRDGNTAGLVIWLGKGAVRPATEVEIRLWRALQGMAGFVDNYEAYAEVLLAEDVIDPFGTPRSDKSGE